MSVEIGETVTVNGVTGEVTGKSDLFFVMERVVRGVTEQYTYQFGAVTITRPDDAPMDDEEFIAALGAAIDGAVAAVGVELDDPATVAEPVKKP